MRIFCSPLLGRGNELRGVLYVESPTPNNFNERDERLLQGLADMAVVALQNAERYEKARMDAQRFELLYEAGRALGNITELTQLEHAYDIILNIAGNHCNGQVVIHRYHSETQELVVIRASYHQYAPPTPVAKLNEGVNGQVARQKRTISIFDTHNPPSDVIPPDLSDPTVRSLVIIPILFKKQYYGNLGVSHRDIGRFKDADVHFFEGLALQLASTIYRLETVQERQEFESAKVLLEEAQSIFPLPFNIHLSMDIAEDVGDVQVIPGSITDIFRHLISNACDAMPNGGKITLRVRNVDRYVALEVSDTGVGIPKEKQSKIFELFFSTKNSSGFGLWSARRKALKNRGDLKVESSPGQGTSFTLFLPRVNKGDGRIP